MRSTTRKSRFAFRPTVDGVQLEERVVLNASSASIASLVGAQIASQLGQAARPGAGPLAQARQLNTLYRQQFRDAQSGLQQYIANQVSSAFGDPANVGADGRLTAQARANLQNTLNGAINATALRLSAQTALLPGATNRNLVSNLQTSILGNQANSLASRIASRIGSGRLAGSAPMLANTINRQVTAALSNNAARLGGFLSTTPLARLSVDATTGQRIPITQFMGNQAIAQLNNTFGTLANSVGPLAQTALFDADGVFNPQAVSAFQQQFNTALNTAAFQTGSLAALFPNSATATSQLQSALFGSGVDATTGQPIVSLASGLAGLFPTGETGATPFTPDLFNTNFQDAFTGAFQGFDTSIRDLLLGDTRVPPDAGVTFQLPTGFFQSGATFPSLFGSQFTGSSFNSGFNNGFATTGNGFIGFGTAPSDFNAGFGTGFNDLVSAANTTFGFSQPTNLGGGLNTGGDLGGGAADGLGGTGGLNTGGDLGGGAADGLGGTGGLNTGQSNPGTLI
jgi:hypothetical protein